MNLKTALKVIEKNAAALRDEHHVRALYIFGSFARGEGTAKSDVDLLVEFSSSEVTLFGLARLKIFLESILKRKVDLVTSDALVAPVKAEVERDAIRAA
jgi:uncharacterized protein